jgi:predicted Zn-dependent peptidase
LKPIRAVSAWSALLAATFLTLAGSPARASTARALGAPADSATRATWTLKNGTRVLLQHVPEAQVISISVGYPGGSDQDPADLPGLAQLLAELQFTAAAGDVPARTREELSSLRPAGADLHVGRQFTVLTELATPPQFPGVLSQVIARMRGTQPDAPTLAKAVETVALIVRHNFRDQPSVGLYNEITERASGVDDAGIARLLALDGLRKLTPADVTPRLAAAFPSRNAVITIAGNLAGFEMRTLLDHALEGVPGGRPPALPPIRKPHGAVATLKWPGLDHLAGGVGVFAPALDDTTHPTFFLVAMILGAKTGEMWGVQLPPLTSQFQYSVIEDPDLVRFYPPLTAGQNSPNMVGLAFTHTLGDADNLVVSDELLAKIRDGVGWLLGAPLTDNQLDRMRVNSTTVILCSEQMAERELRGGEAFWRVYRQRLEDAGAPDLVFWLARFRNPANQAGVLLTP